METDGVFKSIREKVKVSYRFVIEAIKEYPQSAFWVFVVALAVSRFV